MPQGRVILKSISQSKKLSKEKTPDDSACLLYTWLILHVDKNGCIYGDARMVNSMAWPRRNHTDAETEKYIQELVNAKLILRYEQNGDQFIYYPDFADKQPHLQPEREGKTFIPLPTPEQIQSLSIGNPDLIQPIEVNENQVKGSEMNQAKEIIAYHNANLKKIGWIKKDLKSTYARERIIVSRLKEGRLMADLKTCSDNFIKDKWDERSKFFDINYCYGIIKNVDMVDKWLNFKPDLPAGVKPPTEKELKQKEADAEAMKKMTTEIKAMANVIKPMDNDARAKYISGLKNYERTIYFEAERVLQRETKHD